MKKVLIGASLFLTSLVSPAIAEESKGIYLSVGGGVAFPSDVEGDSTISGTKYDAKFPTDSTGVYSIGIGKEFNDKRLEFNYSAATVETDSITVTSGGSGVTASITPNLESDVKSYMFYGYKDFENDSKLTPYAGVGLGWATFSAKDQTATLDGTAYSLKGGEETVFSLGLKAGAAYEIADNTSLYSEGTYQRFGEYEVKESGYETVNYDSTQFFAITAGLRFTF
tara:strand:+ start:37 stop:711 length:675 start_codon:yes stop_codon:yes gene_type:complete